MDCGSVCGQGSEREYGLGHFLRCHAGYRFIQFAVVSVNPGAGVSLLRAVCHLLCSSAIRLGWAGLPISVARVAGLGSQIQPGSAGIGGAACPVVYPSFHFGCRVCPADCEVEPAGFRRDGSLTAHTAPAAARCLVHQGRCLWGGCRFGNDYSQHDRSAVPQPRLLLLRGSLVNALSRGSCESVGSLQAAAIDSVHPVCPENRDGCRGGAFVDGVG
ncbi:hypothetical protein D3C76_1046550 [compost metagenome]